MQAAQTKIKTAIAKTIISHVSNSKGLSTKLACHFLCPFLVHVPLRVDRALVTVQNGFVGEILLALVAAEPAAVQEVQMGFVSVSVVGL